MRPVNIMRMAAALCLLAAVPVLAAAEALAGNTVPVLTAEISGGGGADALLDGDRSTKLRADGSLDAEITLDGSAASAYLIWDGPAEPWELRAGGTVSEQNSQGFLHEYLEFEEPVSRIGLGLPAGAVLCDLYFFPPGQEIPDWVQRWEPPCGDADMLVLPTHADDEHLWFGGALPYCAGELGLSVQVAYMTNHWGEPYRPHEILNGLWKVGVRAYPVMGPFPDMYSETAETAAAQYGRDAVTAWQTEMLRRFKPEVVIAHDVNGEYGHGAHMLNAETLLAALELSDSAGNYPESAEKYGLWQVKKAYLHLWPEGAVVMDWDVPLEAFGGRTAFEMAQAGYGEHVSQHVWDFAVLESGPFDCRKFGLAWSTVGPDKEKNDFFENIVYEPEPEPEPEPVPEPRPESKPEPVPESGSESGQRSGAPGGDGAGRWIPWATAAAAVCMRQAAR